MSTIAAGTSSGTALVNTGDTTGALQLQVNGTTPSVTLATTGAIGVGSTPGYGTAGQLLQSNGSAAAPTWVTAGASALTLLSTVTASSSATVDVETTFSSTYDAYMLVVSGAVPTTNSASLQARMKISGSYVSAQVYYSLAGYTSIAGNQVGTGSETTEITLINVVWGSDAKSSCDLVMYIFNPSSTAFRKQLRFEGTSVRNDSGVPQLQSVSGSACIDRTDALTGIRFFASSGNISAGQFRLYGIANS
jgi:hypothetical protein